eukprot:scaffold42815_cov13-Tisochrysis_lutea.AAC.1
MPDLVAPGKKKKRKDYANQVQLRALRKGLLTSKLARALPRQETDWIVGQERIACGKSLWKNWSVGLELIACELMKNPDCRTRTDCVWRELLKELERRTTTDCM